MRLVAAAAILLALAAGCGGSTASKPKTKPAGFADRVQVACLQRNGELRQLSRPRNRAEFSGYALTLLNIVRYYRGQLAALHPSEGRPDFARYRRLLRDDEASTVALLKAVRRGDKKTVVDLMTEQRDRSSVEQGLLRRLGVNC